MPEAARILIVDDEPSMRKLICDLLRALSYSVESAADGIQALAKLDTFGPDLVITDLNMPRLDGIGLARMLHEQKPGCSVILMSTDAESAANAAGVAGYLAKPVDLGTLKFVVEAVLGQRRGPS
jgi:two-component system chemotaxis response regulator CheY